MDIHVYASHAARQVKVLVKICVHFVMHVRAKKVFGVMIGKHFVEHAKNVYLTTPVIIMNKKNVTVIIAFRRSDSRSWPSGPLLLFPFDLCIRIFPMIRIE